MASAPGVACSIEVIHQETRKGTWRHRPLTTGARVSAESTATTLRTLDGLHLAGTLVTPGGPAKPAVVLVHGGGVTREEGGFFTRLAAGLADAGVASLRFDQIGRASCRGRGKISRRAG